MSGSPEHAAERPTLVISEIFSSLQGEGSRAGQACWFVRLAGCNLSCSWCDTTYTWKPGQTTRADRRTMSLDDVLESASLAGLPLVEVTGGEPLLQPGTPALLSALCDQGHLVLLDTHCIVCIGQNFILF